MKIRSFSLIAFMVLLSCSAPKEFQYMPGINNKIFSGIITDKKHTNKRGLNLYWLKFGDTALQVSNQQIFNMAKVGEYTTFKGVKRINKNYQDEN